MEKLFGQLNKSGFIIVLLMFLSQVFAKTIPLSPAGMIDLSQGKSYTVTPLVPIQYSYASSEKAYYQPGALTNGQLGSSATFGDGQWQGYLRGGARTVVVDLGQVNTITQVQERFFQDISSGITFPRKVEYYLSMNDSDWAKIGTVYSAVPLNSTNVTVQTYKVSGINYQARYVKMVFTVDVWVFADEFQISGYLGVVNGASVPQLTAPVTYPDAYCPPGAASAGGIKNMVLIYNGYYKTVPEFGENTVDDLIPYAGYETTSGSITDFMFDGFLFLPYAGAPSGGSYDCTPSSPTVKSDWDFYINNSFDSKYNLAALDSAVGVVKKALNNSNYKAKVEIGIPYPTYTSTNFGDVDSDGVSENLSTLSEREKVLHWYINRVLIRWSAANYSNLQLVGFYWFEEQADYDVEDSVADMIKYTRDFLNNKGLVLSWIPFYQAAGFAEWDSLGFNAAFLQPNYAFNNFPEEELGDAADAMKKLGMGVEIEIHWSALSSSTYRDKYYAYLDYGVSKSYMTEAAHMYYQNGGPGTFYQSCLSADPGIRNIYDQTYNFIKGTYKSTTAVIKQTEMPESFSLLQNYPNPFNPTTVISYSLAVSGDVSLKVYNVLGQVVASLYQGYQKSGSYKLNFDAAGLPSGVYFYRLQADGYSFTKKMEIVK